MIRQCTRCWHWHPRYEPCRPQKCENCQRPIKVGVVCAECATAHQDGGL